MRRRHWLMAGSAVVATAAGLAWRLRSEQAASVPGGGSGLPSNNPGREVSASNATFDLWSLRFDKPGGGELAMASLRGQPLILNFWGSWCPPCIEEMPLLDQFAREHAHAGWQVLGLAVDNPEAVRSFLARRPVSYAIGLAGLEGSELARRLGNNQGALPYTVVFNRLGQQVLQKNGSVDAAELKRWSKLA